MKFKEVLTMKTGQLIHTQGSALNGPANSLILLNGMFGGHPNGGTGDFVPGVTQGVGDTSVIGNWYTPAYADSMKATLDYTYTSDSRQSAVTLTTPSLSDA